MCGTLIIFWGGALLLSICDSSCLVSLRNMLGTANFSFISLRISHVISLCLYETMAHEWISLSVKSN
jgi:hypothetical protein